MSTVSNQDYIDLVNSILEELDPDQPVKVSFTRIPDPRRRGSEIERMAIALDVDRGPKTRVLFDHAELLGLSELRLAAYLREKLVSIGVNTIVKRERKSSVITDSTTPAVQASDAEAQQIKSILAKRTGRPVAAPTPVEPSLEVSDDDVLLASEDEDGGEL